MKTQRRELWAALTIIGVYNHTLWDIALCRLEKVGDCSCCVKGSQQIQGNLQIVTKTLILPRAPEKPPEPEDTA
jgi:hypothetical protein